jgi:hypothetical protein
MRQVPVMSSIIGKRHYVLTTCRSAGCAGGDEGVKRGEGREPDEWSMFPQEGFQVL